MTSDCRVAVVGAGAAGLSVAWFLKQAGYRHITVFELADRIGGKCKSLTYDGRSFDLGANYITSSYTQVRRLADEFGMGMFTEASGHALNPKTGKLKSLLHATTKEYGLIETGWAAIRYLYHRFRLRYLLAPASPGFLAAVGNAELCAPFNDWLERRNLGALEPVFNAPITLMGYSKLSSIPAAYALTYLNPWTFKDLMLFALNPPLRRWPKRFDLGYERLWERVAAKIDVLRGAKISHIERGDRVKIEYKLEGAQLTSTEMDPHHAEFDALILACPLMPKVLSEFLTLSGEEEALFGQVELDPFVVATYPTPCSMPISAVTFIFPRPETGHPYVVTQQYAATPLLSIYSRIDKEGKITGADVLEQNRQLLRLIGADNPDVEPYTYDEFPYFPHISGPNMSEFYRTLESWQGVNRTYYVGGLLAFELVETIVEYSRHLVSTHFGGKK